MDCREKNDKNEKSTKVFKKYETKVELQIVEIRLQIVELDLEYPAVLCQVFSFWCQVLLRNKIYNTQRQKITTAVKKKT